MSAQHTAGRLIRKDTPDYAELFATDPRAGSLTAHVAMVGRAEDADRIALCWNLHDELLATLKGIEKLAALGPSVDPDHIAADYAAIAAQARAAIAKATGSAQ